MAKILILEADVGTERQLREAAEQLGVGAQRVSHGDALLEAVRENAYDLVICDAQLPTIDAVSIAKEIKTLRPNTRLILTTGPCAGTVILNLLRNGADDVINKPVDPFSLRNILRRNVEEAKQHAERARAVQELGYAQREINQLKQRLQRMSDPQLRSTRPMASTGVVSGDINVAATNYFTEASRLIRGVEKSRLELETAKHLERGRSMNVDAWVAHPSADFVKGLGSVRDRMQLRLNPPLSSGGEIFDKLSDRAPQVLIVGDNLPDMPMQMVLETVKSQAPSVCIVQVSSWGQRGQSLSLFSGVRKTPHNRPMLQLTDLLEVLKLARAQAQEDYVRHVVAKQLRSELADYHAASDALRSALGL